MANREINEVRINGVTMISTREDTVTKETLLRGVTAHDASGEQIVGELDPVGQDDAYLVTDEEGELADNDYLPFYDSSEGKKKKSLFSHLVDKLKSIFVTISGNTVIEGQELSLKTEVDASKPDNGVEDIYEATLSNILDKEGRIINSMGVEATSDGKIETGWIVKNYNTDGQTIGLKGISFSMDKQGNLEYTIADEDAFREAIKTIDQIGTAIPNNSDLDNYKTAGTYAVTSDESAQTMSHIPVQLCGKLIVSNNGNGGYTQFYIQNHEAKIFTRTFWNNAWSAWKEIGSGGSGGTHTYELGTEIPANSDFNDYTTAGVYRVGTKANAETISNIPVALSGKLIVGYNTNDNSSIPNWKVQFYISNHQARMFERVATSGDGWLPWVEYSTGKHTYEVGTDIPANSDLNTYITDGVYRIAPNATAATISNMPLGESGKLIVSKGYASNNNDNVNKYVYQHFFKYIDGNSYTRWTTDGGTTWSDWETTIIYRESLNNVMYNNVKYRVGDYISHLRLNMTNGQVETRYSTNNGSTWSAWKQVAAIQDVYALTSGLFTSRITDNQDLDDYVTGGTYDCFNATTAKTLSNCPTTYAFKMQVDVENNPSIVVQTITIANNTLEMPYRRVKNSSGIWGAWYQYASTSDITPSSIGNGYAVATISGSAITATIDGFQLRAGAIVSVLINSSNIPSNCTLNISGTGAKAIYVRNRAIKAFDFVGITPYDVVTFMYDGTYYRILTHSSLPSVQEQGYVADTSGSTTLTWGAQVNAAQIKFDIAGQKLRWNYYKNSAWRGDVTIADYYDIVHRTLGTDIPDNADLNNYTTNGIYNVASNARALTLSNCPCGRAGKLIVMRVAGNAYITQIYITYSNSLDNDDGIYKRNSDNGGWLGWLSTVFTRDNNGNKEIYLVNQTSTADDKYIGISTRIKDTTTGKSYGRIVLKAYQDHQTDPYGFNLVMDSGGNTIIGGGESAQAMYGVMTATQKINEFLFLLADSNMYLEANANTIANRQGFVLNASGKLLPVKAETVTDNFGDIGESSHKLANLYVYKINGATPATSENVIVANQAIGIDTALTSLDDIPLNTAGRVGLAASISPIGSQIAYQYICYGDSSFRTIELTRVVHQKLTDEKWYQSRNSEGTWTGWMPISRQGTYVGTCTTAAGERNKVATVDDDFSLKKGVRVAIKFTNTNTYASTTSNPITLNVNNTGAKYIYVNTWHTDGTDGGVNAHYFGTANRYIYYIYDGTYWVWDGTTIDANNTNFLRNDASSTLTAATPYIRLKASDVDITQANNGVTATKYPAYIISDKNTKDMSRLECVVGENGNIATYLQVRNYKSDGTNPNGGLWIRMNKSGEVWYGMTNPHNFNAALGCGFATCTTAEATTAKVATFTNYIIATNGYVSVKFTYAVPASATLNINSQGAKSIYYRGAAIKANVIKAGDLATFIYQDSKYHLLGIDRTTAYDDLITGTGTAAQDKGSGVSPRYFPAKWTFDTGRTATAGDIITIKIPVAGHDYGVFVSVDNGSNYIPVALNGTGRLTTHFPINQTLQLVYEPDTTVNSVYPVAGGDARVNITGVWRVLNYRDNDTVDPCYLGFGYATCATAAATAAKVATLSNYTLRTGGYVSVKFTYDVPANATLNINSRGAKNIYYRGAAIKADVIKAGDLATFVYSGQYHLVGIDRTSYKTNTTSTSAVTAGTNITVNAVNISTAGDVVSGYVKVTPTSTISANSIVLSNLPIPLGGTVYCWSTSNYIFFNINSSGQLINLETRMSAGQPYIIVFNYIKK